MQQPPTLLHSTDLKSSSRQRVCLFGLSADPPTGLGGHLSIVRALLRQTVGNEEKKLRFSFNQIWVLPVYRHTFRDKQQRLESFEHRYRMCELAFLQGSTGNSPLICERLNRDCDSSHSKDGAAAPSMPASSSSSLSSSSAHSSSFPTCPRKCLDPRVSLPEDNLPRVIISDAERKSWEAAFTRAQEAHGLTDPAQVAVGTASLIDYLQAVHPNIDFSFCLGEDSFLDLVRGKWKESDRVMQVLHGRLWVVPRVIVQTIPTLTLTATTATATHSILDRMIQDHAAHRLLVPDRTSISSSQVRVCRDVQVLQSLVTNDVLDYIQSHKLYAFSDTATVTGN